MPSGLAGGLEIALRFDHAEERNRGLRNRGRRRLPLRGSGWAAGCGLACPGVERPRNHGGRRVPFPQ